jgi:hypothetical protein
MNFILTQQALNAVRRNISGSLTDTFQMMFQMDILQAPSNKVGLDDSVCAYMELDHQATKACITITITRQLIKSIADQLAPGGMAGSAEVIQDIVCEITNIVGNHLRSYLSDKMGVEFIISLPKPGPPKVEEPPHMFNLHFRIRENDCIDLDFSYAADRAAS